MSNLNGRLKREHDTLTCMTQIYCDHHHGPDKDGLCPDCGELMRYAAKRLEKCPYGSDKPTCANCPIHCYKPAQREMAQNVMRFAGPRMPWKHPLRAITHLFDKLRRVRHPMDLRREQRRHKAAGQRDSEG